MKITPKDYNHRNFIYNQYATGFQSSSLKFDEGFAKRWAQGYKYYFRGWLPKEKSATIADVACGSGRLLYFFLNLGYSDIVGVDISPEQVFIARQVVPNITEGDVFDWLDDRKDSFDLIVGLDIVEHFTKVEALRFVDFCFSALRPGGRLILQTPNADSPFGNSMRYGDFTHEISFTPNLLSQLLRLSKFDEVEIREAGPVPSGYSLNSTVRFVLWQIIRLGIQFWNLMEMGSAGSNIFTRNFIISAIKPTVGFGKVR